MNEGAVCNRLSLLAGRPDLLVESLIMNYQFSLAAGILHTIPDLRDDAMLLHYARCGLHACMLVCLRTILLSQCSNHCHVSLETRMCCIHMCLGMVTWHVD